MAERPLTEQLNQILGRFGKKEEKQEEAVTTVKDFIRFDPKAIENRPRLEIRYQVLPSQFGSRELSAGQKDEKSGQPPLYEGAVPIISEEDKLRELLEQLECDSKKSELLKYRRIKKQSDIVTAFRKEGKPDEEIDSLIQIMPTEYDINITTVPFNIKDEDKYKKSIKIFINDLGYAEVFDRQLTVYRDEALNNLLEKKISKSAQEIKKLTECT